MGILLNRKAVCWGVLASVILTFVPCAGAALILPGQAILAPPEPDPVGGVVIAGGAAVPFASATFSGTLTSTVIQGDASNPFGGLTFTYLLTNDPTSPGQIGRLTTNGFAGFSTDVSWQPGPGLQPTYVDRSLLVAGDVVGFTFFGQPIGAGPLPPGQSSMLLVVQTNSQVFAPSYSSVIDGSVTSVSSFAPLPEPATLSLLAFGGLATVLRRRRGRQT